MLVLEVQLVPEAILVLTVVSVFQVTMVHEVPLVEKALTAEPVNQVHEVWKVQLVHLVPTANQVSPVTLVLMASAPLVMASCLLDIHKLLLIHLVLLVPKKFGTVFHSCTCLVTIMPTSKILDPLVLV